MTMSQLEIHIDVTHPLNSVSTTFTRIRLRVYVRISFYTIL